MKTVLEAKAIEFAFKAHDGQMYGEHLYTVHLSTVAQILKKLDDSETLHVMRICGISNEAAHYFDEEYIAAAWLHDVIEDTSVTREQVRSEFGGEVEKLVWACTGEGKNRKERTSSIYRKLREYPWAINIKLADRIANVEFSAKHSPDKFAMYKKEWKNFNDALCMMGGHHELWHRLRTAFSEGVTEW